MSPLDGYHTTRQDKGDQPSDGETTLARPLADDILRHSPNYGTLGLPNDDDDELWMTILRKPYSACIVQHGVT